MLVSLRRGQKVEFVFMDISIIYGYFEDYLKMIVFCKFIFIVFGVFGYYYVYLYLYIGIL